jgi:uncharacterized lipoprotein YehR (DUF1307 family)
VAQNKKMRAQTASNLLILVFVSILSTVLLAACGGKEDPRNEECFV